MKTFKQYTNDVDSKATMVYDARQKNTGEFMDKETDTMNEGWKSALAGGLLAASTMMGLPQDAEAKGKPHKNHSPRHQVIKAKGVDSSQITPIDAVAKTLWGEARGEGISGINDVASVIMNRAKSNPANLVKVVTAPKQFSVWNAGIPTVKIKNAKDQQLWAYCQKVASDMVAKTFKPTHNYSYYFNPKLANPSWAVNKPYEDRGNHRFLKV